MKSGNKSSDTATLEGQSMLFAVYGTLRKNHGNHYGRLDGDTVEYVDTIKTEPKYTMVDACGGGYPAVHLGGKTEVVVELYRTSDPRVIQSLYRLEGYDPRPGAVNRFYDVEKINTPYGEASMFVFRGPVRHPVIESGDWNEYRGVK